MKKLLISSVFVLTIIATSLFVGCSSPQDGGLDSITLKLSDTKKCSNCSIKWDSDHDASASYYITPENFDYDKLEEKGYKMRIVVSYSVYYKKDYDVLWDIGYAGSPKYEVSIMNNDLVGVMQNDLTTKTASQSRSISYTTTIADLRNTRLILTFSTNNVQNIIYFKNITVKYSCNK